MIDDGHFNALCAIASDKLPNLALRDESGAFVRFATKREVVDAATTELERVWGIEINTSEYNDDDEQGVWDAYASTHITAAGGAP